VNARAPDDYRRTSPRFQGDNFAKNLTLVTRVQAMAKEKGIAASQLALAWVVARGEDIVPIPGIKRRKYLEENARAAEIELTADDLERLDEVAPRGVAVGTRYAEGEMRALNR
jgi:aryl-alcohol dehydrogenase-like predicted oxidoreductase